MGYQTSFPLRDLAQFRPEARLEYRDRADHLIDARRLENFPRARLESGPAQRTVDLRIYDMSLEYAWEKFHSAVRGMAVSPKSLPDRIADAFRLLAMCYVQTRGLFTVGARLKKEVAALARAS